MSKKRKGVWVEAKTFTDPDSKLSVVVSERIRGRPEYSMQFIHIDSMGPNRHLPWPCPGAKHKLADIMFSLAKMAQEYIDQKLAEIPSDDKVTEKKPKQEGQGQKEKKSPQGGLSALSKKDAEAKGLQAEGKTARKRKKKHA